MATKTLSQCAACGYPIAAEYLGQTVSCPMCGTVNEAISDGVTIPTWLFATSIGLAVGVIFGPAILGSTEAGSQYLAKAARKKFAR